MVAEVTARPAQDQEVHQASLQELEGLNESLRQADGRTKELEAQLETLNKVRGPLCHSGSAQEQGGAAH